MFFEHPNLKNKEKVEDVFDEDGEWEKRTYVSDTGLFSYTFLTRKANTNKPTNEIDTLKQMSNGTNNKCFICGQEGHFAKDCEEYYKKKCDKNNEKCNCPTSYFSPHRKIKCLLNNIILCDESDEDDEES